MGSFSITYIHANTFMISMKLLAIARATDFDKVACAGGDKKETCMQNVCVCMFFRLKFAVTLHVDVALEQVQIRYVVCFWSLGRPYGFTARPGVLQF